MELKKKIFIYVLVNLLQYFSLKIILNTKSKNFFLIKFSTISAIKKKMILQKIF